MKIPRVKVLPHIYFMGTCIQAGEQFFHDFHVDTYFPAPVIPVQ